MAELLTQPLGRYTMPRDRHCSRGYHPVSLARQHKGNDFISRAMIAPKLPAIERERAALRT